jgi:hypothetical protein
MKRMWSAAAIACGASIATAAHADETDQVRAQMRSAVTQMEGTTSRLRGLLRDARSGHDGTKIACIDEALSRADVSLRNARDAMRAALGAFAQNDQESARAFARAVTRQKGEVRNASIRADACAAGIEVAADTTIVVVHRNR